VTVAAVNMSELNQTNKDKKMKKQTYHEQTMEINKEIIEFMKKHPTIYGKMRSIQEFYNYHNKKDQEEIENSYENGWEGND